MALMSLNWLASNYAEEVRTTDSAPIMRVRTRRTASLPSCVVRVRFSLPAPNAPTKPLNNAQTWIQAPAGGS